MQEVPNVYFPEVGEAVVGDASGLFGLGSDEAYVSAELVELTRKLNESGKAEAVRGALGGTFGYGADFKNGTFEMHPYWWGECTCGADDEEYNYNEACLDME